jgi:hypothetical protein
VAIAVGSLLLVAAMAIAAIVRPDIPLEALLPEYGAAPSQFVEIEGMRIQMIRGHLELWPVDDLDARGFLRRRNHLSGGWVGKEQAADRARDRKSHKQSIHGQAPDCCSPGKTTQGDGGRATRIVHVSLVRIVSAVQRLAHYY